MLLRDRAAGVVAVGALVLDRPESMVLGTIATPA